VIRYRYSPFRNSIDKNFAKARTR